MSSTSSIAASATSSLAAASSSAAAKTISAGSNLKVVGIILAIASGFLIGSSFVFKKKGLLRSQLQAGGELGEGVAYLKSPLWWLGMSMMILGELCNFAAYAFVEAIVVTPLGALSVVICAILSSIFLNEKLSFFGWLGCTLCILGSTIIALNGPSEASVGEIREFQKLFLSPGFIVYASILIAISLTIIFVFAPKYGKKSMLWYISVCSMIGGISVSVTTGLGAAIVTSAMGNNQFNYWFTYFLAGFVIVTLITEVYYLNVALALFNTAMVTPTYYVIFTFFSIVTTIVLFKGLSATPAQIITLVLAFLVICVGITILQMSKVDPKQLSKLDRRSTMLLQAARSQTESMQEKDLTGIEDPGMDALRGSFGTVGSIIRARSARRMSQSSHLASGAGNRATRFGDSWHLDGLPNSTNPAPGGDRLAGMKRHQLYDAPVPRTGDDSGSVKSGHSGGGGVMVGIPTAKKPTIKFGSQDVVHQYNPPGTGDANATHEHRPTMGSPRISGGGDAGYPPLPVIPGPPPSANTTPKKEKNLMEMETPSSPHGSEVEKELKGVWGESSGSQTARGGTTVIVPALMKNELDVHSAPPTMYARFARPAVGPRIPAHKDSRELFDNTLNNGSPSITARDTLLSFPSVTDSARSEGWDEADIEREKAVEREKEKAREKERGRSAGGKKRYPKGTDDDDDKEESVRLWQQRNEEAGRESAEGSRGSSEENTEEGEILPPDVLSTGGIRLVPTTSRTGTKF